MKIIYIEIEQVIHVGFVYMTLLASFFLLSTSQYTQVHVLFIGNNFYTLIKTLTLPAGLDCLASKSLL